MIGRGCWNICGVACDHNTDAGTDANGNEFVGEHERRDGN